MKKKPQQENKAGGGRTSSKKYKNNSRKLKRKILIVAAALITISAAAVAILAVFISTPEPSFDDSQEQFTGNIQFQEVNNDFINWDPSINKEGSPQANAFFNEIRPKMISAFRTEGLIVEDVQFSNVRATRPLTIKRNELINRGRTIQLVTLFRSRANKEMFKYEEKEYKDVKYINSRYKTIAKPKDNAAVAGNTRYETWPLVKDAVQDSLATKGVKSAISSMKPKETFMNAVQSGIRSSPRNIQIPKGVVVKEIDCECSKLASEFKYETYICKCPSGCHDDQASILIGGEGGLFSVFSHACFAAIYAGFLTNAGGRVQILNMGEVDRINAGPEKNRIVPLSGNWREGAVKFKFPGPIITPTKPTESPPSPIPLHTPSSLPPSAFPSLPSPGTSPPSATSPPSPATSPPSPATSPLPSPSSALATSPSLSSSASPTSLSPTTDAKIITTQGNDSLNTDGVERTTGIDIKTGSEVATDGGGKGDGGVGNRGNGESGGEVIIPSGTGSPVSNKPVSAIPGIDSAGFVIEPPFKTEGGLFYLLLYSQNLHGVRNRKQGEKMVDIKDKAARRVKKSLKRTWSYAAATLGFLIQKVNLQVDQRAKVRGIFIHFKFIGNWKSNAEIAKKLEKTNPNQVPQKMKFIAHRYSTSKDYEVETFRYSTTFIATMDSL